MSTSLGWEGNHRSVIITLAMCRRQQWFIHLRAQRPMSGKYLAPCLSCMPETMTTLLRSMALLYLYLFMIAVPHTANFLVYLLPFVKDAGCQTYQ